LRELVSSYNCVLATIYNYMVDIYGYKFPIESMYITPLILEFGRIDGFLSIYSPEHVVRDFLGSINAELKFPDMKSVDEAISFADKHLQQKGVVPVNINLRYDILDPLPFDNDYWHFHLIVERVSTYQFRMFDQFENEYYLVTEEHLKKAIDTDFNYRPASGFTPFMFVNVPKSRQVSTFEKLGALQVGWHELASVIEHYPFRHNIEQGLMSISDLTRYQTEKPSAEVMYRILNYILIIAKSREAYIQCLEKTLDISGYQRQQAQDMHSVHQRWMEFRNMLGMALTRGRPDGFIGLEHQYKALIEYEFDTFSRVLNWIEAEGLYHHTIGGINQQKKGVQL
jgi:hypothetical protein